MSILSQVIGPFTYSRSKKIVLTKTINLRLKDLSNEIFL